MHTSSQFLDVLREKLNLPSDYAVHKVLGVTTAQISRYRRGLDGFSDEMAERVALLTGMDPGYVMACSHAQRSKNEGQKANWLRVAAVLLASTLPPSAGATIFDNNNSRLGLSAYYDASFLPNSLNRIYIMRMIAQLLRDLFSGPDPLSA